MPSIRRQLHILKKIIINKVRAKREAKRLFRKTAEYSPILVYQMGKVGSRTVYHSLKNIGLPNPIIHIHFLSKDIKRIRKIHNDAGKLYPYHLDLGDAIRRELDRESTMRCNIVSLVRDPIAFYISDLYQNPEFYDDILRKTRDVSKITQYLVDKLSEPDAFEYVFQWFDKELKSVFGIDVFGHSFPTDVGYLTLQEAGADALIIRLEDLSDVGPMAIADFLGIDKPV